MKTLRLRMRHKKRELKSFELKLPQIKYRFDYKPDSVFKLALESSLNDHHSSRPKITFWLLRPYPKA
jgi:hypothetical protein